MLEFARRIPISTTLVSFRLCMSARRSSTRLHAGYARYFTPPPTELIDTKSIAKFENTTNALPSDANTAVSSERSHYFDIGVAQQLTRAEKQHSTVPSASEQGKFVCTTEELDTRSRDELERWRV